MSLFYRSRGLRIVLPIVTALAMLMPSAVRANAPCSTRTLTVTGKAVTISFCPQSVSRNDNGEIIVHAQEQVNASGTSVVNARVFAFLAGEQTSRAIEILPLNGVGIAGKLHLSLAYHDGEITIESAVLTPGAIPVD